MRARAGRLLSCIGLCLLSLRAPRAVGQEGPSGNPFQALAEHLTAARPGAYRGPIAPWPETPARPQPGVLRARSVGLPLEVHARLAAPPEQVLAVLEALERAYTWLDARGFPLPVPSAAPRGAAIAAYLVPELAPGASAGAGAPVAYAPLDTAEAFALLDEGLGPDELERCAIAALAHAGLLGQDPAEPHGALAAAAAAATWLATGELGCRPDPVAMQRAPELGPLGSAPQPIDAAALWLAQVLARHDPKGRALLPGLFASARQRSEGPSALHARPTMWQALDAVLTRAGESLDDSAIELAASRLALPLRGGGAYGLPAAATVPRLLEATLAALPRSTTPRALLATYGSAYAMIDTRGSRAGDQLRVWLRAEPGPRWSLLAVAIGDEVEDLRRIAAPPRRTPSSFVPVELDAATAGVAIVVTKLPSGRLELPLPEDDAHGFELTVDVAPAR